MSRISTWSLLVVMVLAQVTWLGLDAGLAQEAAPAAPAYPVTVENCGVTTTYADAPTRVVTMNQNVTEILLALGLQDRMVGTAYMDSTIDPRYAQAYAAIPVLSDEYPSKEVILAAQPDLVIAGLPSAFEVNGGGGAGPRADLAGLGIDSFLSSETCVTPGPTIETLYADITALGQIFGVEDRAAALVDGLRGRLARVEATIGDAPSSTVFWYDSGDQAPYTVGCCNIVGQLVELAGGENIFADVDDGWFEATWEEVVARQPDVIVINEASWSTAEEKRAKLTADPLLASLPAVQAGRIVPIDFATSSYLTPRNVDAVQQLARSLFPELFSAQATPASATPEANALRTIYPLTVENCGQTLTFPSAPQRIVTVNQNFTELLLALGVGDRMVGTSYRDDAILPELEAAYNAVPVLAAEAPTLEVLVGLELDFVAGVDFGPVADEAQAQLRDLGVATFEDSTYCLDRPVTIDDIYVDIRTLGVILDVQERAEALITGMTAQIEAVQAVVGQETIRPRVLFYRQGATPTTAACCGVFGAIIDLAGGDNIYQDAPGWRADISWETVVARDPEVIVILTAEWLDLDEAMASLRDNPALAEVTAIEEGRFVTVSFPAIMAGVRTAPTVDALTRAFYPDRFPDADA